MYKEMKNSASSFHYLRFALFLRLFLPIVSVRLFKGCRLVQSQVFLKRFTLSAATVYFRFFRSNKRDNKMIPPARAFASVMY